MSNKPESFTPSEHSANLITSGTLADARIPSGITRDTELDAKLSNYAPESHTHNYSDLKIVEDRQLLWEVPNGINSGESVLNQSLFDFDFLITQHRNDDNNWNQYSTVSTRNAVAGSTSNTDAFCIATDNRWWFVSVSLDGKTLTSKTDNCRLVRIWGMNRKVEVA
jgi:hypothetical protein